MLIGFVSFETAEQVKSAVQVLFLVVNKILAYL